jgi:hypothetical protein
MREAARPPSGTPRPGIQWILGVQRAEVPAMPLAPQRDLSAPGPSPFPRSLKFFNTTKDLTPSGPGPFISPSSPAYRGVQSALSLPFKSGGGYRDVRRPGEHRGLCGAGAGDPTPPSPPSSNPCAQVRDVGCLRIGLPPVKVRRACAHTGTSARRGLGVVVARYLARRSDPARILTTHFHVRVRSRRGALGVADQARLRTRGEACARRVAPRYG